MEESHPTPSGQILDRQREAGRAMVSSWRASGLSMRAFARQSGISERRLGLWRRRLECPSAAEAGAAEPLAGSGFIPVQLQRPSGLEIVLGEGVRIRVESDSDLDLLRRTVAALRC